METPTFASKQDVQADIDQVIYLLPELGKDDNAKKIIEVVLIDLMQYRDMLPQ